MKTKYWALPLVVALHLPGCQPVDPAPPKVILVLSEPSPELEEELLDRVLPMVLEGIGPGDVFLLGIAADHNRTFADVAVRQEFPPFQPPDTDNPLRLKAAKRAHESEHEDLLEAFSARITEAAEPFFTAEPDGLALLDSLELAGRVAETYPAHRLSLLVVASMVERSARLDFHEESLTPERTRQVLEELQAEGRLPHLKGARVHVTGARHPDTRKAGEIREFWLTYFEAVGAQLRQADYGPTLLRYQVE